MNTINIILSIVGILSIITWILNYILKGNKSFFKILNNFIKQLPPKKDKVSPKIHKKLNVSHINVGEVKTDISIKDLNMFLKELEDFDYDKIYIKKKRIREYSNNIQRIINTNTDLSNFNFLFTISILHNLLEQENKKPYLLGYIFYKFVKC